MSAFNWAMSGFLRSCQYVRPRMLRCVGCDVGVGDQLRDLSFARGGGAETYFDGVSLGGKHSVCRRILDGDDTVCVLGRGVLLGVREDIRSARGGSD